MTTTDPWLAWLESKVGIAENPSGSNHTPIGVEYGWDGVPWCAETQSLATLHAFGDWILHTAGVADAIARAKNGENGMQFVDANAEIQVGDLACFDFGVPRGRPQHFHISGIVNPGIQARFETIGGNEGDAVRRQWRDRKYVQCFIRLPFQQIGFGLVPQEEDMQPSIAYDENGTPHAFTRGVDGQAWVTFYKDSAWQAWVPLGGSFISGIGANNRVDGTIDVVGTGTDHATWHLVRFVGGTWSAWKSLGGLS